MFYVILFSIILMAIKSFSSNEEYEEANYF